MELEKDTMLTSKELIRITDKALRVHYREQTGMSRVPSDYLLMFTEGGEAGSIAYAVAAMQEEKTRVHFIKEVYGVRVKKKPFAKPILKVRHKKGG